jgi:hypothetical protein
MTLSRPRIARIAKEAGLTRQTDRIKDDLSALKLLWLLGGCEGVRSLERPLSSGHDGKRSSGANFVLLPRNGSRCRAGPFPGRAPHPIPARRLQKLG